MISLTKEKKRLEKVRKSKKTDTLSTIFAVLYELNFLPKAIGDLEILEKVVSHAVNKIYQIEIPANQLCQIIKLAIKNQSFSINFHYPSASLWRFCTNCDGISSVFQDIGRVSDRNFISPFFELNKVEKEVIAAVINGAWRWALKMIFQLDTETLSNLMKNKIASMLQL